MAKALLLHVGIDSSTETDMTIGISGPIFDDGSFEFIPILESWNLPYCDNVYFLKNNNKITGVCEGSEYTIAPDGNKIRITPENEKFTLTTETRTYSEINARNKKQEQLLSAYVPKEYKNAVVHFDPSFENYTYGDSISTSKGKQISKLERGDYIFFVASLAPYVRAAYATQEKQIIRAYQQGNMSKFVIGYFKVQDTFLAIKTKDDASPSLYDPNGNDEPVNNKIDEATFQRIRDNAHSKRENDDYYIVVGNVSGSAELRDGVRLSEPGSPFKPSRIGLETYGDVGFPRGFKWVYNLEKIQKLLAHCTSCLQ